MDPAFWYYLWATLLVLACALAWATNLLTLPGNWGVVGLAVVFALAYPQSGEERGLRWLAVGVVVALAGLGELVELVAGAAGAAKHGASRRAVVLSVVGGVVGSLVGVVVGVPVPLFGPLVGALAGGALGAFAGTWLGETWKGRTPEESSRAGRGAVVGRIFGTAGKLGVGAVMVVVVAVDAYL